MTPDRVKDVRGRRRLVRGTMSGFSKIFYGASSTEGELTRYMYGTEGSRYLFPTVLISTFDLVGG